MFTRPFNATCDLGKTDPYLHEEIEKSKVEFDMRPGDMIFASRLTFHKTLPVTAAGREYFSANQKQVLNRFSMRFVPGEAKLPSGFSLELSILYNNENSGRSVDEIASLDDPAWYPKVWPQIDPGIEDQLQLLAKTKLPIAQAKAVEEEASFFDFIRENRGTGDEL